MNPTRGENCPPTRTLEAFAVGDSIEVGEHVGTCAACTAYVEAVRTETSAYHRQRPPELFLAQLDRRAASPERRLRVWPYLVAAVGAVAAAAIVVNFTPKADPVTLKGADLHVHRRTNSGSEALGSGAQVRPGDLLRLSVDAPESGFLFIAQLDGTETTAVRFDGPVAGGPLTLPDAIELDAARGPEWFVAVFSTTRLDGAALARQLSGQSQRPRLELSCGACSVSAVRLEKP